MDLLPTHHRNIQMLKGLKIDKTDGNTRIDQTNRNGQCILAARMFPD
jgi:hypothetical protein